MAEKTGRPPVEPLVGESDNLLKPTDKYFPDTVGGAVGQPGTNSKPIWYHKPKDWEEAHGMGG